MPRQSLDIDTADWSRCGRRIGPEAKIPEFAASVVDGSQTPETCSTSKVTLLPKGHDQLGERRQSGVTSSAVDSCRPLPRVSRRAGCPRASGPPVNGAYLQATRSIRPSRSMIPIVVSATRVVTGFFSWVSWPSDSSVAGFSRASAITAAIGRMPPCPPLSHKRCRAAVREGR